MTAPAARIPVAHTSAPAPHHYTTLGLDSRKVAIWAFIGWNILFALSILTIIGWAWVYVAQMRWFCRNVQGTRREVTFTGTGLEFLWRAIVAAIACLFIIPIPWMYRWFGQWLASQTVLAERGASANG